MRPSLRFGSVFFILTALGAVSILPVSADVDPEQVASKTTDDAKPLGQFPQPEMVMATPSAGIAQAPVMPDQARAAAQANFPKVQNSEDELMAHKFAWWPTDAKPAPVKDPARSGYWWWPDTPGEARPWGNQGFVYVRKIIFDYKTTVGNLKPSLVIKRILKNVKVYFDYGKANLRDDAQDLLKQAIFTLQRNPRADILVTGNADVRGSEKYNLKLGERRADTVQDFLVRQGLAPERVRILSRGKLDALAPSHDILGMQKDRNAQFMIAEVEEVMIPADKAALYEDKKETEERLELQSAPRVSTKDYVIKSGDTLWAIAKREYGDGNDWKRIYEFNKAALPNPNRPKKGTHLKIPIE